MSFSFSSLPSELRREILRKANSETLRSLHHAQAGSRSKIATRTNAKAQLAARRKLTAKLEEMYRARLRRAFGTALGALRYTNAGNMQKLSTKQGWSEYNEGLSKVNADGYRISRFQPRHNQIHPYVEIISPLGNTWRIRKGRGEERREPKDVYYIYDRFPDGESRIELGISIKVLENEFGLNRARSFSQFLT